MKKSYITVTDQFCGAGGSSIGATAAGAELRLALNHWKLAVETHNTNFPNAGHDCTDISACDPRRYPSTDVLITSPECTNHSLAKGKNASIRPSLKCLVKSSLTRLKSEAGRLCGTCPGSLNSTIQPDYCRERGRCPALAIVGCLVARNGLPRL
jgi:site-specific DNA-cytosine methylase